MGTGDKWNATNPGKGFHHHHLMSKQRVIGSSSVDIADLAAASLP
jgi:hypothetical protein